VRRAQNCVAGVDVFREIKLECRSIHRVYQNDWSGLEVDYIHRYGEETYKY